METKASAECVSVIIPVYNVDRYIKRCVDSVLSQTYTELEVILVNDGSTDRSGSICDDYAQIDNRVQVIHKLNGGLSDARNAGLAIAKGEYVHFIDSDDFIARDAIEFLLSSITFNNADISTIGYVDHYREDADTVSYAAVSNQRLILSTEAALSRLLYEDALTTSACMKLYRRKLFLDLDVVFPLGKLCEDLGTIYKVFSNARRVVVNTVPKYYYYQRKGSIIQSKFTKNRMDGLHFAIEQLEYINEKHPALSAAATSRLFLEALYILMKIPIADKNFKDERYSVLETIRKYRRSVLCDGSAKASLRQRALLAVISPKFMFYSLRARYIAGLCVKRIMRQSM